MHRLGLFLLVVLIAVPAFAGEKSKTEEQKTLYAIGLSVYRTLAVFNLSPDELRYVKEGFADACAAKPPDVDLNAYAGKIQELALARRKAEGEKQATLHRGFLDQAAREKGAVKTDSGLVYLSLKEGSGPSPGPSDTVKINFRGTFPDGKEFGSSYERGKPIELAMKGTLKCWSEGVQRMKAGGKAKLVCPPETAYGDTGMGDLILPGATLVFEVELLEVKK